MAPVAAGAEEFTPSSVLAAMMTMRTGDTAQKKSAHAYLEKFQKSVSIQHQFV